MDRSRASTFRHLRTSSLKGSDFLQRMNELDETVASLGDTSTPYHNRRRGFTEDGSIGTINTDFGHHVLTRSRVEIGGIEKVRKGSGHRRSKSLASHRTHGSQRSKGSLSLEQLISETILKTAMPDHFETSPHAMQRVSSTEDILKDLQQADAVLACEGISLSGNLLPPPEEYDDEPDLLPPIIDTIAWKTPQKDEWRDPVQWADWSQWQSPSKNNDFPTLELESHCHNDSGESGEKTWHTFDTETDTSMFSDPFWTDFNNDNPFGGKVEQEETLNSFGRFTR